MGRDPTFHDALQSLDQPTEGPLDLNLTSIGQTLKILPTFVLPDTNFAPLSISHISLSSPNPPIPFDARDAYTYNLFTDDDDDTNTSENSLDVEPLYGDAVDMDPDLLNYNIIVDNWNRHNDPSSNHVFKFDKILNHRRVGSSQEVLVDWIIGTPKWEKVSFIKSIDVLSLVKYARDHHLLNRRGWRWCKKINPDDISKFEKHLRFLTNSSSCRRAFRSKKRSWKFGYQIPTSIKDAYLLDDENGNTKWADAIHKQII